MRDRVSLSLYTKANEAFRPDDLFAILAQHALFEGGIHLWQFWLLLQEDQQFIDVAGNSPRLVAILKNLRELSTLYITHSVLAVPDRARRANAEHEEILRAVFAHDPAAAADAVLRHLDGTLGALRTIHQLRGPRASTVHARVGGSCEREQLL